MINMCTLHAYTETRNEQKNLQKPSTKNRHEADIRNMKANTETNKVTKSGKAAVLPLTREEKAKVSEACLKHAPLIKQIATEYVRHGSSVDLEDLMQLGYEALIKAVRDWREDGGATFATIANGDIRNALCTAVGVKTEQRAKDGKKVYRKDFLRSAESLDEPYDDGETLRDLIGAPATQESDLADKELAQVLESMGAEDRAILKASAEGRADIEIAAQAGFERSWVNRKRHAATKKLIKAVNDYEPHALVAR